MLEAPRIHSARMHPGRLTSTGESVQKVHACLQSRVGEEYLVVEIERGEGRFTLILDSDWVRLAQSSKSIDKALVADMELPRACVLAVVHGWEQDWQNASCDIQIDEVPEHAPYLRLVGSRSAPTGADGTARPF